MEQVPARMHFPGMRADHRTIHIPHGYAPVYHEGRVNYCPGCDGAQWTIGRVTAECAYCGTALPLQHTGFEGMGLDGGYWDRDVFRHGWHVGADPHSQAYRAAKWAEPE